MAAKEVIKNNFSKYARYYDPYSNVQDRCAGILIGKTASDSVASILDIGCGTGNYTELLRRKFPEARIMAVDISPEMVDVAKMKLRHGKIEFMVADAEKADFNEKFDIISSNSSFQWFEDLGLALSKYKAYLSEKGQISFSTFGPQTFFELNESLVGSAHDSAPVSSRDFAGKEKIEAVMREHFKEFTIEDLMFKERYASLPELLKNIKYTGTRGYSRMKTFWTPAMAQSIEKRYRERFKDIVATYEVFVCRGVK